MLPSKLLFPQPFELDYDLLRAWTQKAADDADAAAKAALAPPADGTKTGVDEKLDSAPSGKRPLSYYEEAVARLPLRAITGGRREDAR